jgi:hypothetical protein
LSTTTTSYSTPSVVSSIERRQSRAASRHWYVTIRIETSMTAT